MILLIVSKWFRTRRLNRDPSNNIFSIRMNHEIEPKISYLRDPNPFHSNQHVGLNDNFIIQLKNEFYDIIIIIIIILIIIHYYFIEKNYNFIFEILKV